ncbi:hypothetical protein N1031_06025 [Herbiconiux moechotypicola]|uniref:Uncharacterized protein n=1 Tax=Herbiconiux moechotypicola TaxID=637393 RepID=A0ABP5QA42_9MICO|nr:hypothetical protein [Herbiconiux moechotypicola]MCS5729313.1 hypothetical protein [Herbiconiux moechotypicola]
MSSLLDRIVDAHGGSRWNEIATLSATRHFGGAFWALKGVPGIAEEGRFTVDIGREHTQLFSFGDAELHSDFTPGRVEIVRSDGEVVESLDDPRSSFAGHVLTTPWNRLQLAYFTGYAMWTYNTEPRSFLLPGVVTDEVGAWTEPDGQVWERLRVTYPSTLATHSTTQTLYADSDGILRRRDYEVDIAGGSPSVEYMTEQVTVDGIVVPRHREIYVRDDAGRAVPEPLIVSIDIDDIVLG